MKILASILSGLVLSVSAVVLFSSMYHPVNLPQVDMKLGRAVFVARCAACHSVEETQVGGLGPSLVGIGDSGAKRVPGLGSETYISQSILYPDAFRQPGVQGAMPTTIGAELSDDEVRAVVGYLVGLDGKVDARRVASLDLTRPQKKQSESTKLPWTEILRGKRLFDEDLGCSACHGIYGFPGEDRLAPSLSHAGLLDPDYIRQSIQAPSAIIVPSYQLASLHLQNGNLLTGRVLEQDDKSLTLLADSIVSIKPLSIKLEEILKLKLFSESEMPLYTLSVRDENALVAFLRFLVGET